MFLLWFSVNQNTLRFKSRGFSLGFSFSFSLFLLFSLLVFPAFHSSNLPPLINNIKASTGFWCPVLCFGHRSQWFLYLYFNFFFLVENIVAPADWWGRMSNMRLQDYVRCKIMLESDFSLSNHVSRVCHGYHWKCSDWNQSGNHGENSKSGLTVSWLVKSSLLNLSCPNLNSGFSFKQEYLFYVFSRRWLSDFCDYCPFCSIKLLQKKHTYFTTKNKLF